MHKIVKREKNYKLRKRVKKIIIIGTFIITVLAMNYDNRAATLKASVYQDLVSSSPYLSETQKNILVNDDLFLDLASSNSRIQDKMLKIRLKNLMIVDYNEKDLARKDLGNSDGYYQIITPNVIHIRDYELYKSDKELKDVLTHEFAHLLQIKNGYKYITEATAEIISNEYYGSPIDSYKQEVIRVKVLMELLGSDCIWQYLEGNGSGALVFNLLKYLSPVETIKFLKLLSTIPSSSNEKYNREEVNEKIDKYLAKIYLKKYNIDISNDILINAIYSDEVMNRQYFNTDRRTSDDYKTFALNVDEAHSMGYDIYSSGNEEYNVVAIVDDVVIIEEKNPSLQLNLSLN